MMAKNKQIKSQQYEIERLEKEIEGRRKHIAYLRSSPERESLWRKCMRILELWRDVITMGTGMIAMIFTISFIIFEFSRPELSFDNRDRMVGFITLLLWLNWFLELSKEYYDDPPQNL